MLISRLSLYSIITIFFAAVFTFNAKADRPAPALRTKAKTATVSSKSMKVYMTKKEMRFAKTYIQNSKDNLVSIQKRSAIPFNIIDSVFSHYGLPKQLKYLAVIESELKPSAKSKVGARGPWQLMPTTATELGLKVNRHVDERTNYYKSTRAAALYLRDLNTEFNNWLLVIAAYNGGPGPVNAAIRASGSRNFWTLQKYLPEESSMHVKKFLATYYYFEGTRNMSKLAKTDMDASRKGATAFAQ